MSLSGPRPDRDATQHDAQEPKRPAKLPPPPRAELLKQQQEEEERRKAAAAAKLADIERRIAARQEAEAKAAAEAAAAEAAAQELAAATAAEAGAPEVPEVPEPVVQEAAAVASEQPAKPAAPLPEQTAPPNAWVKPLTLANGVLDAEHAAPAVSAADSAATTAEDAAVPPETQTPLAPQASEPPLISLTSEPLPAGDAAAAAAAPGSVAEPADAPRGQRPQRGRGRARAERLYDPEQADRRVMSHDAACVHHARCHRSGCTCLVSDHTSLSSPMHSVATPGRRCFSQPDALHRTGKGPGTGVARAAAGDRRTALLSCRRMRAPRCQTLRKASRAEDAGRGTTGRILLGAGDRRGVGVAGPRRLPQEGAHRRAPTSSRRLHR